MRKNKEVKSQLIYAIDELLEAYKKSDRSEVKTQILHLVEMVNELNESIDD